MIVGFKKTIQNAQGVSFEFWPMLDFVKNTDLSLPTDFSRPFKWGIVLKPYTNLAAFMQQDPVLYPDESLRQTVYINMTWQELDDSGTVGIAIDRIKNNTENTFFNDAELVEI